MADEEIWYADSHMNIVKQVTAKYKRQRLGGMWAAHFREQENFFSSREAAIAWKRDRLLKQVEYVERSLKDAQRIRTANTRKL